MTGTSFQHHKRRKMTPQRVLKIYLAANGRCHVCGLKLPPGTDYEIDHIIALENGGTDDDSNLCPVHIDCHKGKSEDDHGVASKGRKAAANLYVPSRFHRQSKGWRR